MIDEKLLIENLRGWQNRMENKAEGDFVNAILEIVISKINAQPKIECEHEEAQMQQDWKEHMMQRFDRSES